MARTRMLDPGLFLDEALGELTPMHRLLFAGLWTLADREGRLEDKPKTIQAQVLPWDKCDPSALLDALASKGLIVRYIVDGRCYISIRNFLKYQTPHVREKPSEIPEPGKGEPRSALGEPRSALGEPRSALGEPRSALGEPRLIQGEAKDSPRSPVSVSVSVPVSVSDPVSVSGNSFVEQARPARAPEDEVFDHWAKKLNHPRAVLDDKRRKLIREQLKLGTVDDLKRAIDGVLVDIQSWPERQRFDGIEYVFENRASVEKFLDLALKGNPMTRAKDGYYRPQDMSQRPPPGEVKL